MAGATHSLETIKILPLGESVYEFVSKKDVLGALETCDQVNNVINVLGKNYYLDSIQFSDSSVSAPIATGVVTSTVIDEFVFVPSGPVNVVGGFMAQFEVDNSNTGPATLTIGATAYNISRQGAALVAGDLEAGRQYLLTFEDGASEFQLSEIHFVDTIKGNDSTAVSGNEALPYKTITAAQSYSVSGDLIKIAAGLYADYNLGVDGVIYDFAHNAILNSSNNYCFYDLGTAKSFTVVGFGNFQSNTAIVRATNASTVIGFVCNNLTNANDGRIFYMGGGATIRAFHWGKISTTGNPGVFEAMFRSDSNGAGVVGGKIYVSGIGTVETPGFVAQVKQATSHDGYIEINSLGGVYWLAGGNARAVSEQQSGTIVFNTKVYANTTSIYGLPVFRHESNFTLTVINGDVVSSSTVDLLSTGVTGSVIIKGDVTSASSIAIANAGASYHIKNCDYSSNKASTPSISISAGSLRLSNCRVKNLDNNAASHGVTKTGGTLILDNVKVVTTHAASESLNTTGAQDIKVYSGYANKAITPVFFTNLIAGTTFIVDAEVE